MDPPYYPKSELCGDVMTVSFLKYLPWQVMHILQCSTHFSKKCCRLLVTSKFLALELQKLHGARCGPYGDPLFPSRTQNSIQISPHAISGLFQPWKGSSRARNFEVTNCLQHIFKKWVEHCKICITCQERYFKKETVTVPPQSSDSEE
jgi:hypothetical protein